MHAQLQKASSALKGFAGAALTLNMTFPSDHSNEGGGGEGTV